MYVRVPCTCTSEFLCRFSSSLELSLSPSPLATDRFIFRLVRLRRQAIFHARLFALPGPFSFLSRPLFFRSVLRSRRVGVRSVTSMTRLPRDVTERRRHGSETRPFPGPLYTVCAFDANGPTSERASEPYVDSTQAPRRTSKNIRARTRTVAAYEKYKQVKSLLLVLGISSLMTSGRALVFKTLR